MLNRRIDRIQPRILVNGIPALRHDVVLDQVLEV